jgi:ferredoxin
VSLSPEILAARLESEAREFLAGPGNYNGRLDNPQERAFGEPIFGYALGSDPIWATFKKAVDLTCLTPAEAFSEAYPEAAQTAPGLWVMVFVLPQTAITMREHNRAVQWPSEGWARSRAHHGDAVDGLTRCLLKALKSLEIRAVAPDLEPSFKTIQSPAFQIASTWSHRHAGFAAGLGTFGLCDGLITRVGKAHRMGSLVVNHPLPITARTYRDDDYRRDCLWFNSGVCGRCVDRCPAGAITYNGRDKAKCASYLKTTMEPIAANWPDLAGAYACGLCQSRVPCAVRRPKAPKAGLD